MGKKARFKVPATTATLTFDGEYEGLWVTVRRQPPNPGVYAEVAGWEDLKDTVVAERAIELFASAFLLDWNADDDDGPIPATFEGFTERLDLLSQIRIVHKWVGAFNGRE